jgi:hypothetical protein
VRVFEEFSPVEERVDGDTYSFSSPTKSATFPFEQRSKTVCDQGLLAPTFCTQPSTKHQPACRRHSRQASSDLPSCHHTMTALPALNCLDGININCIHSTRFQSGLDTGDPNTLSGHITGSTREVQIWFRMRG